MSSTESVVALEPLGNNIGRIKIDQKYGHLIKNIIVRLPLSVGLEKCAFSAAYQLLAKFDARKIVENDHVDHVIDFESLFPGDKIPSSLVTDQYKQSSPLNLQNVFGNKSGFPIFSLQSLGCDLLFDCPVDTLDLSAIQCTVNYTPSEPLVRINYDDKYFLPMVIDKDAKIIQFIHGFWNLLAQ